MPIPAATTGLTADDSRPAAAAQARAAADRVVAVDPRTGTTTADLWPPDRRLRTEDTHDVDDWLAVIAAGRCVGVTAESTLAQHRRGVDDAYDQTDGRRVVQLPSS